MVVKIKHSKFIFLIINIVYDYIGMIIDYL